jgi:hypothetical protein
MTPTSEHEARHSYVLVEHCPLMRDLRKPRTNQDCRDSTPVISVISSLLGDL